MSLTLQHDEVELLEKILRVVSSRGAILPLEFSSVGPLYNKIAEFLSKKDGQSQSPSQQQYSLQPPRNSI
jgi:hypothetical protein